jgi:hypothetical protein
MIRLFFCFLLCFQSSVLLSEKIHKKNLEKPQENEKKKALRDLKILGDLQLSHQTGAYALLTLGELYEALIPHKKKGAQANDILIRSSHMLLDIFLYFHFALIQHEILGHGARLREYNATNINYRFGLFHGSAAGFFKRTNQTEAALSAGGIEASDVMAHIIHMEYLESSIVKPHRAFAHLFSFGNQGFYIHMFQDVNYPGHDIAAYIKSINAYAGSSLSMETMRLLGIFDYLNPYLYYSLYGIGNYIVTGGDQFKYPMIQMTKDLSYLPATRLVMAPYGPEIHLLNYFRYREFSGQVNFGVQVDGAGNGFTLNAHLNPVVFFPQLSIGAHFALWHQPEMTLRNMHSGVQYTGMLLNLKPSFRVVERFFIEGQVGYKTAGFVQGEVLSSSPIVRLGLRYQF